MPKTRVRKSNLAVIVAEHGVPIRAPKESQSWIARALSTHAETQAIIAEAESFRHLEIALADAEDDVDAVAAIEQSVRNGEIAELLDELIDKSNKKSRVALAHLAYLLSTILPGLDEVSKRAARSAHP